MSETRTSNPYISHLVVTQRTIQVQVPTDYQDQAGNRLYQNMDRPPGIMCEVTPYLTETIKGPAQSYIFPCKALYQEGIAQLEAKPTLTEQEQAGLDRLKAYVASTEVIWAEDVAPDFSTMWADAFSDVLDIFPEWKEVEGASSGVPLHVLPMEWECRVPYESAKSVNVNIGVYASKDGVANTALRPSQHTLSFEDNATKTARELRVTQMTEKIAELTGTIAGLTAEIAALPEGPTKVAKTQEKTRVEADKANWEQQLSFLQSTTKGLIGQLIALPSIQQSLPSLSVSILMALSQKEGWGLDQATTAAKLVETLGALASA